MIGCTCPVCTSTDPRNYRRRTSLYIRTAHASILIDTPPDLRDQVLRFGVDRVDAVLLTHVHADHVNGFDDLRSFCNLQRQSIPVYGAPETVEVIGRQFAYTQCAPAEGTTVPKVVLKPVEEAFHFDEVEVVPLRVWHGRIQIFGYKVISNGIRVGYIPDCSGIPEPALEQLRGIDVMILDATRNRPHPTHFGLEQSIEMLGKIGAGRSYITHLCHDLEHVQTQKQLPKGMEVPYDGLQIHLA